MRADVGKPSNKLKMEGDMTVIQIIQIPKVTYNQTYK